MSIILSLLPSKCYKVVPNNNDDAVNRKDDSNTINKRTNIAPVFQ